MGATCRVRAHGALLHRFYGKISLDAARDQRSAVPAIIAAKAAPTEDDTTNMA